MWFKVCVLPFKDQVGILGIELQTVTEPMGSVSTTVKPNKKVLCLFVFTNNEQQKEDRGEFPSSIGCGGEDRVLSVVFAS